MPSDHALVAFDLAAVHCASGREIKQIAAVPHGKIVPNQQVASLPFMTHDKARAHLITQR